LEALSETHDIDLHWRSFELRPRGAPPISPEYRARIEEGRPRLNAIAREKFGVEMNPGRFGVDSRPALVGAKVAEAQGCGAEFNERVLRAYWQEALDIGDRDILVQLAREVGLESADFEAGLGDPLFEREVDADVEMARNFGLNGVPAIVFDNKYLVSGAQPPEVLRQVADQVLSERAQGDTVA
jgi:predicted DsbA family dithiol-disulfide isomerase